jgi:hypothetical protein
MSSPDICAAPWQEMQFFSKTAKAARLVSSLAWVGVCAETTEELHIAASNDTVSNSGVILLRIICTDNPGAFGIVGYLIFGFELP